MAAKFLRVFGSHVFCGPFTFDGIFYHSIKVSASENQDRESLRVYADSLLETAARRGYCRYYSEKIIRDNKQVLHSAMLCRTISVDIEFDSIVGPRIKYPEWFEEFLKRNPSLCRIIGRSSTPKFLVLVWEIVSKHHNHLEPESRLLEQAMSSIGMPQSNRSDKETLLETLKHSKTKALSNDSPHNDSGELIVKG